MQHSFTTATLTASALALTGALASASPAAAAPAGNAPSCVAVWQTTGTITKTGYARNDCGRRLRLKIKWARGTDGACHTVDPGRTIYSKVARGPRTFDGADSC
ncbi:hypothetical protein FE391_16940 [Nonomuraea sp. KC401]|uniref:hypothetical protein n=1 Tax=unclassified Nonomuraea TaxID=2593643 RepID=UPI0010FE6B21|nr:MULTISPECIES: hypothetical protein [unclassified Nonomuraea]NBE95290.1 hypothetical protein [Nonomuraea sp. K271]TLF72387.1 hypothetical protein FE391_16940 [Nonomuraea sp. KC401]